MYSFRLYRPLFTQIYQNVLKRNLRTSLKTNNSCLANIQLNCHFESHKFINPSFTSLRCYAKSKDKKKEKGKKKVEINETQLAEVINLDGLKSQMDKCVDSLKDDFIKHLSLRSTTGAIESLPVSLDGKEYTMQELAQIVRKNTNTIVMNLAVFPQAIPAVVKALAKSGMNLNPQQDGTTLYIPVPKVTKEHREALSKNAKSFFIKCKDHIRDTQIKFCKNVQRQENLGTDLVHLVQEQITTIGDQYVAEAEKIFVSKQNELIGKDVK